MPMAPAVRDIVSSVLRKTRALASNALSSGSANSSEVVWTTISRAPSLASSGTIPAWSVSARQSLPDVALRHVPPAEDDAVPVRRTVGLVVGGLDRMRVAARGGPADLPPLELLEGTFPVEHRLLERHRALERPFGAQKPRVLDVNLALRRIGERAVGRLGHGGNRRRDKGGEGELARGRGGRASVSPFGHPAVDRVGGSTPDRRGDRPRLLQRLEPVEQALRLQRPHEALDDAVALGLADVRRRDRDFQRFRLPDSGGGDGRGGGPPGAADRESPGDVLPEGPEGVADPLADRLQGDRGPGRLRAASASASPAAARVWPVQLITGKTNRGALPPPDRMVSREGIEPSTY